MHAYILFLVFCIPLLSACAAFEQAKPKAHNDRTHIANQVYNKRSAIVNAIIEAGIDIDREDLETYRTGNMSMYIHYDRCKIKDLLKIPGLMSIGIYYPPHSS